MKNVVKELPPRNWRSPAMHERYTAERTADIGTDKCPLCTAPSITEYKHWRIVVNPYPYDSVAKRHDLLLTIRHVPGEGDLNDDEYAELLSLKKAELNQQYAILLEALPKNKSIPGHHHLHLIVPKQVE